MSVHAGSNQDPAFEEKIQELIATNQDYPRRLIDDDGFFRVLWADRRRRSPEEPAFGRPSSRRPGLTCRPFRVNDDSPRHHLPVPSLSAGVSPA